MEKLGRGIDGRTNNKENIILEPEVSESWFPFLLLVSQLFTWFIIIPPSPCLVGGWCWLRREQVFVFQSLLIRMIFAEQRKLKVQIVQLLLSTKSRNGKNYMVKSDRSYGFQFYLIAQQRENYWESCCGWTDS